MVGNALSMTYAVYRRLGTTGSSRVALLVMGGIVLAALVAHFFSLGAIPRGFYVDESSIAYNAWRIAQDGVDEYGERWPLFFRAFGEYKNPLYIYFLAGMYRVFGYSEWITRAASATCWLFGSALLMDLGRRLYADAPSRIYLLICLCFTPWLFSLSRISFELISLYPLIALHLVAVYRAYEEEDARWAAVAGLSIGLTVYAYSTFRMLAPLHTLLVVLNYPQPRYWRRHAALLLAAAATAMPFALYLVYHGANLLGRFNVLTFLHDQTMTLGTRLTILSEHYLGYFSIDFLAVHGDLNLRHHIGHGGQLLPATFLLLVAGVAWLISTGKLWQDSFPRLIAGGCLLAPLGAALTRDEHHSLRAMTLAIYVILISAWAMHAMAAGKHRRLVSVALALTALNAISYTADYFTRFAREESASAFEGFGFKEALDIALAQTRGRVLVSDDGNQPYIQMLYYTSLLHTPPRVPVAMANGTLPGRDDLMIRFAPDDISNRERWNLPAQSQFVIVGQPGH